MAKGKTAVAIGILAAVAVGAYAVTAGAAEPDDFDDDLDDDFDDDFDLPGWEGPGAGPGGAPKAAGGGKTYGEPAPGASYSIPVDWDPIRGLWISPDCEMVVEAPGWFCGSDNDTPYIFGAGQCNVVEFESYADTMAEPGNGVVGYIEYLVNMGAYPDEIAGQIVGEAIPPECWSLPAADWPPGLWAWWEGFLARVTAWWEEAWGIPFEPEEAA